MFVIEGRFPNVSTADLATLQKALRFICDRLTYRGEPVRCLSSMFLPDQARLRTLFETDSAEAVRRANDTIHAPFVFVEAAIMIDPSPACSEV